MTDRARLPEGIYTALVTPFRDGALDRDAWRRLVERQAAAGVAGVVPAGCTGEAAALSREEREWMVRSAAEICAGRCVVLAGSGTNVTDSTIALTRDVAAWGADAAMLITPYYNKPQQHGLAAHYRAVAAAVDLPLVLYNVPGRTGVNLLPETVAALADLPNVAAVKEASGNLEQIDRLLGACDLQVFSGDDGLNLAIFRLGAHGAISVLSNLVPAAMTALWRAWRDGDTARAEELFRRTEPLVAACFRETNPVPVKFLLAELGYCAAEYRLPLVPPLPENAAWLREFLETTLRPLLAEEPA